MRKLRSDLQHDRQELVIQMRGAGCTLAEIAEVLGCSRQRVHELLRSHLGYRRLNLKQRQEEMRTRKQEEMREKIRRRKI